MLALLALIASVFSGISKLAIDASIQERVPERLRASAFGHSETVLMIAWVLGGALGIIPLNGRLGVALVAVIAVAAAIRAAFVATRLRHERLHGRPDTSLDPAADSPAKPDPVAERRAADPTDPWPTAPTVAPHQDGPPPAPSGTRRLPPRAPGT